MIKTFGAAGFGPARLNGGVSLLSLGKPAAAFPGRVATDADLMIAVDRQQTRLASPLDASATSMTVENAAAIGASNLLTIDNEIVKTTGPPVGNVVPISRGFDGTTPALHLASATVSGFIDAYHHNALVAEVEAIQQALGPNLSHVPTSTEVPSGAYDFAAQSPGGSLTVGTNVITVSPVPLGVNGSDQNHYLYISGGAGAAEAVLITGGTAVSGAASGTLFIACANAHSGAWTIRSATAGIQEAIQAHASAPVPIALPPGTVTTYATITLVPGTSIRGAGKSGATSGGTYVDASAVTSGWAINYESAVLVGEYAIPQSFTLRDFRLKAGLHGIKFNDETNATPPSYQGYLTDNLELINIDVIGNSSCLADPDKNTAIVPTLAGLRAYGVGISLTFAFRARIQDCFFWYLGIPIYIFGDENLIEGGGCGLTSIGVYYKGDGVYGNKNLLEHFKLGGMLRLGMIWTDACGGTFVSACYFEQHGAQCQLVRAINNCLLLNFGPNNWVQSPFESTSTPSFHLDLSTEALIHDNTALQGPFLLGPIELDYTHYQPKYPNIVRMSDNGSYFPQPGNRGFGLTPAQVFFPRIPGVLVGPVDTLLWNPYNNPGDWTLGSSAFPFILDPVTGRWVFNNGDASANAQGWGSFFSTPGRRFRTFNLSMSARKTGTGIVFVQVTYVGNASTDVFAASLTFTNTAETSVQTTGNFTLPSNENLDGHFRITFLPAQALVEEMQLIPVS